MTGHLFVIACPVTESFLSRHALLKGNKDSVNGTGIGFMVWGEAYKKRKDDQNLFNHKKHTEYAISASN
jgi:hypothetical protein